MQGKDDTLKAGTMERMQEAELIRQAKCGDHASMRELIDAHKDRLHAFVWRMLRNHHDSEELSQDAFLKAFSALNTFDTRYRFSTWLFTIAYRLCLNQLRRKRSLTGEMDFNQVSTDDEDLSEQAAQSEEAARLKKLIWQAVDQLTVPQRATVLLFYRQEQSCAEIARILQLPVSTVKSHLHRARTRLKGILEPAVAEDLNGLRILSRAAG
ncbi:MAG: sigma-70 family RNA polymerase sigma factor [Phycisphaerae bacterium]|nr:sigma-70 family RNA polymerase sigma factor [Phycisphaerae bacterium]